MSPKMKSFIEHYLANGGNGTQAAISAGYSEKGAGTEAERLLKKAEVQAMLSAAIQPKVEKPNITAELVLKELLSIATADPIDFYDEKGDMLPIHKIPEHARKTIASIKTFEEYDGHGDRKFASGEVRDIKRWDKTKALELLGRHLKMFTDKVEHSGRVDLRSMTDEQLKAKLEELRKGK